MKIKKFRIFNYKSINDSEDCYLSQEGLTIIAGKNEAGKTSVLEALRDFNIDMKISVDAMQLEKDGSVTKDAPKIQILFEFEKAEIHNIYQTMKITRKVPDSLLISILKTSPDKYTISDDDFIKFGFEFEKNFIKKISDIIERVKTETMKNKDLVSGISEIAVVKIDGITTHLQTMATQLDAFITKVTDEKLVKSLTSISQEIKTIISEIALPEFGIKKTERKTFQKEVEGRLPNFILFSSFNDVLPNIIPIATLEKNPWIIDLQKVSDVNPLKIKSTNLAEQRMHKQNINLKFNDEYKEFWSQDNAKMAIDWDTTNLMFWIEEDGISYKPEQRSQGKRWHLAFYIKITSNAKYELRNVILIDEPGLYLHAIAQDDILKKLEEAAKTADVIFTTHSPYLLQPQHLDRIRLMQRTPKDGSKIQGKIHKNADKETLTPIYTSIGIDITQGICNQEKKNNIVVEGIADYYYLNAFEYYMKTSFSNYVFGGGAGSMPVIGSILLGWHSKIGFMFDYDKGKKDGLKNIKENWSVFDESMIIDFGKSAGDAIEDIFSKDDFKKYVLCEEITYDTKNSEYVKKEKFDKALISKQFYEKVKSESIQLSDETKKNIQTILDKIKKYFEEYKE
jgi:predicted ATP-dependent endonuclease of OLD family